MVLDFYPVKNNSGTFLRVLTFEGATQSKKVVSKKDMISDVNSRLSSVNHIPYSVVDFNLDPQLVGGVA